DLDDLPPSLAPHELVHVLTRQHIWLVAGERPVPPRWFEVARSERLELVRCDRIDRVNGFRQIITALRSRLAGPTGAEIATLVLSREPHLAEVKVLVSAVCQRPWAVRRPRHLAAALGITLRSEEHTSELQSLA